MATIRYRDRKTGRFARASTWRRSRAQLPPEEPGRYKRERIKPRALPPGAPIRTLKDWQTLIEEEAIGIEEEEAEGAIDYD